MAVLDNNRVSRGGMPLVAVMLMAGVSKIFKHYRFTCWHPFRSTGEICI